MQTRRLGNTSIHVSVIGLGTVKFGRNQGLKYPAQFELPSDDAILDLLSNAQALGVNLLDTAPAYGSSEERLGKLLQGQRHQWVISTKAGEEFDGVHSRFDFSPHAITSSVERSLKRLHTDYLDIVLVHSSGDDVRIIEEEQVFATLAALKNAGKIRAYGMSTKTIEGGLMAVEQSDVAMVTFHPEYTDERAVIAHAHQLGKGIFIKKALASGHLTRPVPEIMQYILAEPGVTSVVVGTLNADHLREIIFCFNSYKRFSNPTG